jgi:hypothetical protein
MPSSKIKHNALKIGFFLSLVLLANSCLCQEFPVLQPAGLNKNLKLITKVITIKSKHFIIPCLKLLSDSQVIQFNKEITYANERIPFADCFFILQKVIKNKLVNMYAYSAYHPSGDNELITFTTKDALADTICIEDFIPLETGQYVISLVFNFYLNGVKDFVSSDEVGFFVTSPKTVFSTSNKRPKKRYAPDRTIR